MKENDNKMKKIIDEELKAAPLWKRNKRKREMIENIDAKIVELGEEWETNDESLRSIKKEINDQVEDLEFQIEDGIQQMYDIQTELGDLEKELENLDDEDEPDSNKRSEIHQRRRELIQRHERLYTDIQRMKDKKDTSKEVKRL